MKLCIYGDREITDPKVLMAAIKASKIDIKKVSEIVSGGAKGADRLGELYAKAEGLILTVMEADWKDLKAEGAVIKENAYGKYNSRAGAVRNQQMAEYADIFLGLQVNGQTSGSQDMLKKAKELGKPVFEYSGENKFEYKF